MAEAPTRPGSARDEILSRVRAATEGALSPARPTLQPSGPVSVDLFAERVADYRAVVERCPAAEVASRVAAVVAGLRVLVPEGLAPDVTAAVERAVEGAGELVRDTGLTPAELDAVDVVVTEARVGIAETGTIVLDHGAGQGRRALTLVPDRHVCVVRADQVVADVPDAVALLDPARPQTWISGPSATSDIELDRVEGVHGPRLLHVVIVD
ncbi:LUD domain-containing protein [Nocardioides korecus]